jgi:hypothetical protein
MRHQIREILSCSLARDGGLLKSTINTEKPACTPERLMTLSFQGRIFLSLEK